MAHHAIDSLNELKQMLANYWNDVPYSSNPFNLDKAYNLINKTHEAFEAMEKDTQILLEEKASQVKAIAFFRSENRILAADVNRLTYHRDEQIAQLKHDYERSSDYGGKLTNQIQVLQAELRKLQSEYNALGAAKTEEIESRYYDPEKYKLVKIDAIPMEIPASEHNKAVTMVHESYRHKIETLEGRIKELEDTVNEQRVKLGNAAKEKTHAWARVQRRSTALEDVQVELAEKTEECLSQAETINRLDEIIRCAGEKLGATLSAMPGNIAETALIRQRFNEMCKKNNELEHELHAMKSRMRLKEGEPDGPKQYTAADEREWTRVWSES